MFVSKTTIHCTLESFCHTVKLSHGNTLTLSHCYTVTLSKRGTGLSHRDTVTLPHRASWKVHLISGRLEPFISSRTPFSRTLLAWRNGEETVASLQLVLVSVELVLVSLQLVLVSLEVWVSLELVACCFCCLWFSIYFLASLERVAGWLTISQLLASLKLMTSFNLVAI